MLTRLAPAKVNLYLHVAAPDQRGYHPLRSLVVFADTGDQVALISYISDGSVGKLKPFLSISGPFAGGLSAGEDNLVVKAVRRFEATTGTLVSNHRVVLHKNLPIASGIGGGSADAGAVLHLLRDAYAPDLSNEALESIAASIGADGVMCLWARPAVASGYGEVLAPAVVPVVDCVLINPLVECATPAVFGGYDALEQFADIHLDKGLREIINVDDLVRELQETRNDLQAPAIQLQPVIADVLRGLEDQPETRLARMSGSGATCFALCASPEEAVTLAARLQGLWPSAWVRPCRLG